MSLDKIVNNLDITNKKNVLFFYEIHSFTNGKSKSISI